MPSSIAYAAARAIIGADVLGAPVQYANEEQQTPDAPLFVRVSGRSGSGDPGEVGPNPFWTEVGAFECIIFAAMGSGTGGARAVADELVARFRGAADPYVEWLSWDLDEGSADDGGDPWWKLILTVRYRTQTIIT